MTSERPLFAAAIKLRRLYFIQFMLPRGDKESQNEVGILSAAEFVPAEPVPAVPSVSRDLRAHVPEGRSLISYSEETIQLLSFCDRWLRQRVAERR